MADFYEMMAGGGFAAGARLYWRPAGALIRNSLASSLCIGGAVLFGGDVHSFLGLSTYACGAIAGLGCIGVAQGVLIAADKFDLSAMLRKR